MRWLAQPGVRIVRAEPGWASVGGALPWAVSTLGRSASVAARLAAEQRRSRTGSKDLPR